MRLKAWSGCQGIEIYNGVIGRLNGSPDALRKWETPLTEGRRVWGYANDDSHAAGDVALGWNVVYVNERSRRPLWKRCGRAVFMRQPVARSREFLPKIGV